MPASRQGHTALSLIADNTLRPQLLASLNRVCEKVHEVSDLADVEQLPADFAFDLALVDGQFPETALAAICSAIRRQLSWHPLKPIVVLADDVAAAARARRAGATDFVLRPVDWPAFEERLRFHVAAAAQSDYAVRQREWLRHTQRQAGVANFDLDIDSGLLLCSEEITHLLGRTDRTPPRHLDELFAAIAEDDRQRVWEIFEAAILNGTELKVEFRLDQARGENRILLAQSTGIKGQRLCGTLQDVTEGRRVAERLSFLASYDELTLLANRNHFKDILAAAMAQAQRSGVKLVGLFMDLDKFQRINDSLGPNIGDQLLRMVANRVKRVLRGTDCLARNTVGDDDRLDQVARLGGDEFTILLVDVARIENSARVAQRILDALKDPFVVEGHEIVVSASIGITIFPDDSTDLDSFMKNGDAAMFHAKAQGRNNYQLFNESLHLSASSKLALEGRLRRAMENRELVLHYQPKIDAGSGRVLGVEALVRWSHPDMGLVPPSQFIPIAEETGLIIPIGEWVLNEACRQAIEWQDQGLPTLSIGVNLSALQFRGADLSRRLADIIAAHGVQPECIDVELTESMLMYDVEDAIHKMHELRGIGLTLSIDDFGTGYSSLSYLMRFPLNTLKIDRSFVSDLATDSHCASITRAILMMAKSLDLTVVAEGVETSQQATWLRENQCDILQGYYFSRPLPADELARFCTEKQAAAHRGDLS